MSQVTAPQNFHFSPTFRLFLENNDEIANSLLGTDACVWQRILTINTWKLLILSYVCLQRRLMCTTPPRWSCFRTYRSASRTPSLPRPSRCRSAFGKARDSQHYHPLTSSGDKCSNEHDTITHHHYTHGAHSSPYAHARTSVMVFLCSLPTLRFLWTARSSTSSRKLSGNFR